MCVCVSLSLPLFPRRMKSGGDVMAFAEKYANKVTLSHPCVVILFIFPSFSAQGYLSFAYCFVFEVSLSDVMYH